MHTIAEQMQELGIVDGLDESPQQAAERIWMETGKNPLKTIEAFENWARQDSDRMLDVLGRHWYRSVKVFLSKDNKQDDAWRYSDSFRVMWKRLERKDHSLATQKWYADYNLDPGLKQKYAREYWRRKANGTKRVYADVDAKSGALIRLIDKEFGPFAHIRINGRELFDVTTEEALRWSDMRESEARFVRSLCAMIPDPRTPIGEQWTAEMITEAKRGSNVTGWYEYGQQKKRAGR